MTLLEAIEKILPETPGGMHVNDITDEVIKSSGLLFGIGRDAAIKKVNGVLSGAVKKKGARIVHVKNKNGRNKKGYYRKKRSLQQTQQTDVKIRPLAGNVPAISTMMLGKAGEYAVVSKLLLNGYYANVMSVDDGVDIIASKNQNVYFIQVKTSTIDGNLRCKFSVKKSAFHKGHNLDVRYILVVRHGDNQFVFIRLTDEKISDLINHGLISDPDNSININVKFDEDKAVVYRGRKEEELEHYTNNFNL